MPLDEELGLDSVHVHDFEDQDFVCILLDTRAMEDPRAKAQQGAWRVEGLLAAYREMTGSPEDMVEDRSVVRDLLTGSHPFWLVRTS